MPGRLAIRAVWFFGLGALGMQLPFFGLYLHENAGLPGTRVGAVLGLVPLIGLAVQPLWGQLADLTGARARLLVALSAGSALGYGALARASGFEALLAATALLALFQTAFVPSAVSVTLALAQGSGRHEFGLSRVWGTFGFLAFVVAFPPLLHAAQRAQGLAAAPGGPSEPGLELMFPCAALALLAAGLAALALPRTGEVALRAPRGDWRLLLRQAPFLRALALSVLGYLFLQGPLTLFPLLVRDRGGSLDAVSGLWVPMLLLEIPLVALSGVGVAWLGERGIVALGLAAGGVRWLVCALAGDLAWLYPVQLLHGVTVAGFVLGAPLYVERAVPERLRSTAQGLLAMFGASLGGISSNLAAGWLLEHAGASAPYLWGGLGGIALGLLAPWLLPRPSREAR